jgi:AcrR family transcriptional regulator
MCAVSKSESQTYGVRQRITDSAADIFAAKGFDKTTARDITEDAECNLALINYHFGGKENLYAEVFKERLTLLREVRVDAIDKLMRKKGSSADLEELLEVFAGAFFRPLLDGRAGKTLMGLMWREMTEPHLPEGTFYNEVIAPVTQAFINAMAKVCPKVKGNSVMLCIESFVAQLAHVIMMRKFIPGHGKGVLAKADIKGYVQHVVKFTAAGIRSMEGCKV